MSKKYRNDGSQSGPAITAEHVTINNYYVPPWMAHGLDEDEHDDPPDQTAADRPTDGPVAVLDRLMQTIADRAGECETNSAAAKFLHGLAKDAVAARAQIMAAPPEDRDRMADAIRDLAQRTKRGQITATVKGKRVDDGVEYSVSLEAEVPSDPAGAIDRIREAAESTGLFNVRTADPGEDNIDATAELMASESGGTLSKADARAELDAANNADRVEMPKIEPLVLDTLEILPAETERDAIGSVRAAVHEHATEALGPERFEFTAFQNDEQAIKQALAMIVEVTPDGERYRLRDNVHRFAMIRFEPVALGVYRLEAETVRWPLSATSHHIDRLQIRPLNQSADSIDGARLIMRALQLDMDTLDPAGRDFRAYIMADNETTLTIGFADGSGTHFGVEPGQPVIVTTKNPADAFADPKHAIGATWCSPAEHIRTISEPVLRDLRARISSAEAARLSYNYETTEAAELRRRYLDYLADVWPVMKVDTLAHPAEYAEVFERVSTSSLFELNAHHYGAANPARLLWLAMPLDEWMDLAEAFDELADGTETAVPANFAGRLIGLHESERAREAQAWTPESLQSVPVVQAGGAFQLEKVDDAWVNEAADTEARDHLETIEGIRGRKHWVAVLFRTTSVGIHDTVRRIADLTRDAGVKAANPFLVNWAKLFAHRLRQQTHSAAMGPYAEQYHDLFGVEQMEAEQAEYDAEQARAAEGAPADESKPAQEGQTEPAEG